MKKIILTLLIFCIAIIVFLPSLLSTYYGKFFLIRFLESRLHGNVSIEEVHLSWSGPQVFNNASVASPEMIGTIRHFESPAPFWKLREMKTTFQIQGGTFTFPTYSAQIIQTDAKIQGNIIQANAATPQGGSLNIQGTYLSKDHFNGTVKLHEIPTIFIAKLLKADILPIVLGPTVNLNGTFSQGTLSIHFSSPLAGASINAGITNNKVSLTEPIRATLQLTDDFRNELLKHISPSMLTDFSLKNPVTLYIPSGSFRLPFSHLEITNAELNLGQARLRSGETLRSTLSIFKKIGKRFDIWFTPITFSIQGNALHLERFDALLDQSVHLCAWGELRNHKVRMMLGIPSDTIKSSFGIQTLSSNYVLTIPVHGTLQHPKFDTGPAIAKIAAMSASKEIPSKAGKIFGGALNLFTQAQGEDDIPPPKRPFPWE
ncbi:MAG TPA: hypothetical protein VLE96_03450 [Chlamydiales bacterium]|nr:hypothetical protein [Chlamydiales bacterium]